MIIGSINVKNNAVITHRDSYLLKNLSVVSVRKPYLAGAILLVIGMSAFGIRFADLLTTNEILAIAVMAIIVTLSGTQIGQLSLLSRDLKGSELSGAVWGHHASLQDIRTKIVTALHNETSTQANEELS